MTLTPRRPTSIDRTLRRWVVLCSIVLGAAGSSACGFWFLETRSAPVAAERQAPAFELPDQEGRRISLRRLLEGGPVVIVFYRGHW